MNIEIVALTGGVGGAKLALGLDRLFPAGRLACVANTGDDFDHLGLRICPDVDTLMYTLAGCSDPERGWGRANETWTFMRVLERRILVRSLALQKRSIVDWLSSNNQLAGMTCVPDCEKAKPPFPSSTSSSPQVHMLVPRCCLRGQLFA